MNMKYYTKGWCSCLILSAGSLLLSGFSNSIAAEEKRQNRGAWGDDRNP